MREEVVRAYNRFVIELMHPYADRMSAVASIPMHTPEEAIRHLDYAVGELGHKVVCMQGWVDRPIAAALERAPGLAEYGTRLDYFGLDSEYDYDQVWAKCVELKVAPTFHSASGLRAGRSVTNYTQNHIGSIAQAQEGLAKSLFFGWRHAAVPHPQLRLSRVRRGVGVLAVLPTSSATTRSDRCRRWSTSIRRTSTSTS